MPPRLLLPLLLLTVAVTSPASALTIERTLRPEPSRLRLATTNGVTTPGQPNGVPIGTAGRPDLPWIAERVDLPAGMKVTAVEVVGVQTELLQESARVATAPSTRALASVNERTTEDPAIYGRATFQPEVLATLGVQGGLRGRNVAYLRVAPARWNPQSGRLERITSLQVRLTLADGATPLAISRPLRLGRG